MVNDLPKFKMDVISRAHVSTLGLVGADTLLQLVRRPQAQTLIHPHGCISIKADGVEYVLNEHQE